MGIGFSQKSFWLGIYGTRVLLLCVAVFLSACAERDLQVSLLSRNFFANADFKITNAINDTDLLPDASQTKLSFAVECSAEIIDIEVLKAGSEWVRVSDAYPQTRLECAEKEEAAFEVPLEDLAPFHASPSTSGTQREKFKLRYTSKNRIGDIATYERDLYVLFPAPVLTITAASMGPLNAANYVVSGTCSSVGGDVEISGPYSRTTPCTNAGTYSVSGSIGTPSGTSMAIQVRQHDRPSQHRAWGEVSSEVAVDFVPPTLSLTSPANGSVFSTENPLSNLSFQGTCSEPGRNVILTLAETTVATLPCQANGSYQGALPAGYTVSDGTKAVRASLTDVAGNSTETSAVSILVDNTPPGVFAIRGLTRQDEGVGAARNTLSTKEFRVYYDLGVDAVSHHISIKDTGGVSKCETTVGSVGFADFNSCNLNQGQQYRVVARSRDAHGNPRDSSQGAAGYTFTVTYPVPAIVSVNTPAAGYYSQGSAIDIHVNFDMPVTVTGTPRLKLSNGVEVPMTSFNGSTRITFRYIVAPGEDTSYGTLLTAEELKAVLPASIQSNIGINANLSLPSGGALGNVVIDTVAPTATVSIRNISTFYTRGPVMNLGFAASPSPAEPDGGNLTTSLQIFRKSDNVAFSPVHFNVSDGHQVTNASEMYPGTQYYVRFVITDRAGNSKEYKSDFTAYQCPTGFVYVYSPSVYENPFCVGSTEAKQSSGGLPEFKTTGAPWVNITYNQAKERCEALGAGYYLMDRAEWNAVADMIARDPSNRLTNTLTSVLYVGNTGGSSGGTPAAIDEASPAWPNSSMPIARRYFNLKYGQKIWDFSGNAWELIVWDLNASLTWPTDEYVSKVGTGDSRYPVYVPESANLRCSTPLSDGYCGFGMLKLNGARAHSLDNIIRRGGAYDTPILEAGVYSAVRQGNVTLGFSSDAWANTGFRCTYYLPN